MCSVESLKKTPKDIFLDRLLTSNMIWKLFFFYIWRYLYSGYFNLFCFDLNFWLWSTLWLFVCERCYINTFYSAVLLHLWIGMQLEICFLCDVWFVSLPPPAGEWDPNRAGGADITGAGAAPADRHRERRNWASACGDRRYTEVRGDTLVKLSNLRNIIMNYHNHVFSVGSKVFE